MNSLDRVIACVNFEPTDRVPVIAQVFGHAAVFSGIPLSEYLRSGELLATCQLKALEHYQYDAVFALMDVNVETEAAGSLLRYPTDDYAIIESYVLSEASDISSLSVPNPEHAGRMPEILKAAAIMRREVGDDVLVVGNSLGPMTIATQLIGLERALYLAVDDTPTFERLLDFATETCIAFGVAQIQAGAHLPVIFDPSASPAVIPPQFFNEFEKPRLRAVFSRLKKAGAIANWLHIAGPTAPILGNYPEIGVDVANFDYYVDATTAQALLPNTCVDGNIRSWCFVGATPDEIASQSEDLIDSFGGRGGFVLSSGCEIPPKSRPENVAVLTEVALSKV